MKITKATIVCVVQVITPDPNELHYSGAVGCTVDRFFSICIER